MEQYKEIVNWLPADNGYMGYASDGDRVVYIIDRADYYEINIPSEDREQLDCDGSIYPKKKFNLEMVQQVILNEIKGHNRKIKIDNILKDLDE